MKYDTMFGRSLDKRRQDRALPPSKHLAGKRFMTAKNADEILNNFKSNGIGKMLKIIIESIFISGPARHKIASFLYEQKRASVSIIAPIMSKLIHFILMLKNFAAMICPTSCIRAALKIIAYFDREKFFEKAIATIIMINMGDAFITVFIGTTP